MPNLLLAIAICGLVCSSAGEDTIPAGGALADGETLASRNGVFELGFFSPGSSRNRFVGIWYAKEPDIVVWVGNRHDPIEEYSREVVLQVARNGAFVTSMNGSIVLQLSNSSRAAANPMLRLLDTGNLVLTDNSSEGNYIWQSFDYLTDTRLPGMFMVARLDGAEEKYLTSWRNFDDPSPGDYAYKIENKGLPQMVVTKRGVKTHRSSLWNGVHVNVATSYNSVFKSKLAMDDEGTVTLVDLSNSSILTRIVMDKSGSLNRYIMNDAKNEWNLVYAIPKDLCDEYAKCGPNAICRIERMPICGCLDGFEPKFQANWDLQDWSDGCTRIKPLTCTSGDGFMKFEGVKYPDILRFWLNTSTSLSECKDVCFKNCSCTAYAQPYITNGGRGCLMWFGDLIDTRVLPGADKNQNLYIRLPVSELKSILDPDNEKTKRSPKVIAISVTVGALLSILTCGVIVLIRVRRRKRREREKGDLELPLFSFATIAAATDNFSEEKIIGEGGFGPVYKGNLSEEEEIAVKRLSGTSTQGLEEFKNEVVLFSKLQHTNLVRLLGCCIKGDERMLIYEYLENKSLDYFIFDPNRKAELAWPKRYDIILGIARGLLYLHQDSRLKIIHRDLKTSNILLDGNLNPKISDFGLARTFKSDQFMARTRRVVGTYGYMAPEYAIDGKFSEKSDVFSFGVMILEIVSGEKNRGFNHHDHNHTLLGHAWLLWKVEKVLALMDECMRDTFVEHEVTRCMQVGLLCIQMLAEDRPAMSSVVFMLGCEAAPVPEPDEPGFFTERSSSDDKKPIPSRKESVREELTITELEGR